VRAILSTLMFLGLRPARQRRRTACSPPFSAARLKFRRVVRRLITLFRPRVAWAKFGRILQQPQNKSLFEGLDREKGVLRRTTSGDPGEQDTGRTPTVHSEIPPHQPPVNSREPTTSQTSTPEPDSTSVQSTCSSLSKAACTPNTQVASHRTTPTFTSTDNTPRVRLRSRPHRATQTDPPQGRGHHNAIRSL
jgi:hypothetical protein